MPSGDLLIAPLKDLIRSLVRLSNQPVEADKSADKLWEKTSEESGTTPDSSLPPLGDGPRRTMVIEIQVSADFEQRLDNQWMVEREIHADRWAWKWKQAEGAEVLPKGFWDGAVHTLTDVAQIMDGFKSDSSWTEFDESARICLSDLLNSCVKRSSNPLKP